MKLYTKQGDTGLTKILNGEKIYKDDLLLEVIGAIDELQAVLGLVRTLLKNKEYHIESVQIDLSIIMAALSKGKNKLSFSYGIKKLEEEIDKNTRDIKITEFLLPGDSIEDSVLNIARTVCRRVERLIVRYVRQTEVNIEDNQYIQYFNRLSDYLFSLIVKLWKEKTK